MHALLTLLLQIGVVLAVSRGVGMLFRKIRQPQVVGEMTAGILLGPSFLGWVAPDVFHAIFPPQSLGGLGTLSQAGLVLFMFLVGLEFDPKLLRGRGHAALLTSHVSIALPFFLGSLLGLYLYPRLSDASVDFDGFALFMGAAMSVTAFPVLARILQERNLMGTKVGAITIACAAVDDVSAWGILAVVVAIVRASAAETPLWLTLAGSLAYVLAMVFVVRPLLGLLEKRYHHRGRITQDFVAGVILLVLASAYTTEWLGIHALFGAFCLGAVMPKDRGFVHELADKLEHVTVVFLLPLFFASAGLRTRIGLVSGPEMWTFFGLIMLVAVAGKFGGSTIASRLTGLGWREASALGILMNTRGLMELVILTIGLELGVIAPALFAMMVMMALATTFMTTPVLQWLYPLRRLRESGREEGEAADYTILLPVSLPASGPGLLRVARALVPADRHERIYGAHLRRADDQSVSDFDPDAPPAQEHTLLPLLESAAETGTSVRPVVLTTQDPGADIVDLAHHKGAHLVLMGWHKPVVSTAHLLGGVVHDVMDRVRADVGVYVERSFDPWRRVLVPFRDPEHDDVAVEIAARISSRLGLPATVLHVVPPDGDTAAQTAALVERLARKHPGVTFEVKTARAEDAPAAVVGEVRGAQHDLVVIGVAPTWGFNLGFIGRKHERVATETSANLLIVHRYVEGAPRPSHAPSPAAAPTE